MLNKKQVADISASFQKTAVETLVDKMLQAFNEHQPASVTIGGGVAANAELRHQIKDRIPIEVNYIDMSLCTDNAAMIATLGYYQSKDQDPANHMTLEVAPNLKM